MVSYAASKNIDGCLKVFSNLSETKRLTPNSFCIITQALVENSYIDEALTMESQWVRKGWKLPLPVYTSLIDGCVKRKDIKRYLLKDFT